MIVKGRACFWPLCRYFLTNKFGYDDDSSSLAVVGAANGEDGGIMKGVSYENNTCGWVFFHSSSNIKFILLPSHEEEKKERESGLRTAAILLVMIWQPFVNILATSTTLRSMIEIVIVTFLDYQLLTTSWLLCLCRIIVLIEVICAGSFMSLYIGCVHQYNSLNSQPDVLKSLYSALQPSSSLEELRSLHLCSMLSSLLGFEGNGEGFRYHDGGRLSDQQMALLQYQRENLHYLSEEFLVLLPANACWIGNRKVILRLQECLSKYERSDDGSTPQVDLAHLLAARDQELRALSAEMNQVQSELRLARNLIAERDSEIQSIRTTNNQYVEENERLRAILGEWSARAAKLERALEAERMSNLELQKKILKLRKEPTEQHGA
ncbi:hypothetical protein HHK36_014400 [Tetracentron sinense]|uniref:Uncharacterized protein n=1 Tax=Tetracentron sinense TaxID=13715 RepID=A0A834Z7Z2_TETSI|nr:hypothetical protein HHK36_014400 [Tetracentron sinense]